MNWSVTTLTKIKMLNHCEEEHICLHSILSSIIYMIIFYFITLLPHHRYITYINMTRAIWVDKYFNKTCQLSVCWMPGSDAVIHQNFSGNLKASLLVSNLALGNVWSP